jgi:hypothetical protein
VYKFSLGDKIRISRNFVLIVSTHSIISSLQIQHSHLLYVTYCRHSQTAVNSALAEQSYDNMKQEYWILIERSKSRTVAEDKLLSDSNGCIPTA